MHNDQQVQPADIRYKAGDDIDPGDARKHLSDIGNRIFANAEPTAGYPGETTYLTE